MGLDFQDIASMVRASDPKLSNFRGSIKDVFLWYLQNRDAVDPLIGGVFSWLKGRQSGVGPTAPPIVPLPPIPPTPPVVPSTEKYPHIISSLSLGFLFLEDDRQGGSGGEIIRKDVFDQVVGVGPAAQMQNQRMHINCTPIDLAGVPYPKASSIIRGSLREDGKQPCLDYQWWVNGVLAWNSTEMDDPFNWESYEDDGGCTPTMRLDGIESGARIAQLVANWPAQYNGGVRVVSNPVTWRID